MSQAIKSWFIFIKNMLISPRWNLQLMSKRRKNNTILLSWSRSYLIELRTPLIFLRQFQHHILPNNSNYSIRSYLLDLYIYWWQNSNFFTEAHQDLHESQHTSKIAGYQYANNVTEVQHEILQHFSTFVTFIESDRSIVSSIYTSNTDMLTKFSKAIKSLELANTDINQL